MLDIINKNKFIIILIVVTFILLAWYVMGDRGTQNNLLTSEVVSDTSVTDQDIIRLLQDMQTIKLNNEIFQNPAFRTLFDFGLDIIPEPLGRKNPFAPATNFVDSEPDSTFGSVFSN